MCDRDGLENGGGITPIVFTGFMAAAALCRLWRLGQVSKPPYSTPYIINYIS